MDTLSRNIKLDAGLRALNGTILISLLVGLYHNVFYPLALEWYSNPDYSHGFLVPIVSGYLVWERRNKLSSLSPLPSVWGIGLLGLGLLMLVTGTIGAELYLQRSSFIFVVSGLVLLLFGRRCLGILAFPIAFLFFMIPFPAIVVNLVMFPLQMIAAKAATFFLFSLDIPVLREGNVIVLARTTLEVAEACSGLRSLQALLAMGTVYAYFSQNQKWKMWVLVLLSIPIALAANALRIGMTGLLVHHVGVEAAKGFYHTFSGFAVFVLAFVVLLCCGMVFSRLGKRSISITAE